MNRLLAAALIASMLCSLCSVASAQDAGVPADQLGTHPDEGLMIAGGTVFLASVLVGVAVLMPIQLGQCYEPGSERAHSLPPDSGYATCSQAPLSAIPFAHLIGGGITSIIAGPILLIAEVIGLFTFIGGAAHHHPNATPAVTVASVPGADVGLALAIHF